MGEAMAAASGVRRRLDVASVMAEARQQAGLDDYGELDFVEPLRRWFEALASEVALSEQGVEILRATTLRHLVNRLRFEQDMRRHPEILDEDVADPIVIVGLPRTGTTKLQRLLARLDGCYGIPFWQLLNPARFPDTGPGAPDPRIACAEEQHRIACQLFPEFQAGHPSQVDEPDEEMFMMEMGFEVLTYWRADLPSFSRWWRARPREIPYAYLRKLLQYVQWQNGGRRGRSLVLKTPVHLGQLDMIQRFFPKATLVHCHRDPRVSVASNARLHELLWRMAMPQVDPHRVGDEVVDYWSQALTANLAQREQLAGRMAVIDVRYETILRDPVTAIRQILAARHRQPSVADVEKIRAWEAANPQERWRGHQYSQQTYGLSDARIESAFAAYIERFFPAEAA